MDTPRAYQEAEERRRLSPFACKSAETRGRERPALPCDIRTAFQKDRDRITHAKAFRRLMHKTQVFISPEGDHYRTRLTHTLEVTQIARTAARALALNEDLTEAIALGHDLGHTPFGHTGEDALDRLLPGGFEHNEQSVRVVERLENGGQGLNLTFEVIDGIRHHRTHGTPATLEGRVVQLSDKIAYLNHDVDDAIRAGLLRPDAIPRAVRAGLGEDSRRRIDFLVRDLIENSRGKPEVSLSPDAARLQRELRAFLFEQVYAHQLHAKEREKIQTMLGLLYAHYIHHGDALPPELRQADRERAAADYIAGMTDRFALKRFSDIYMPAGWK